MDLKLTNGNSWKKLYRYSREKDNNRIHTKRLSLITEIFYIGKAGWGLIKK
jgi:hypothetical protein